MVHIMRLCPCGVVWILLSNSSRLTWWVRSANPATFSLATVRCQGSKKMSCWRFLMLALMEWRWPRITIRGLAPPSFWFRENQPNRSVAEKKWLTCCGMSADRRCRLVERGLSRDGLLENHFSSHDGRKHLYLTNLGGFDREEVVAEQDHVGELAGCDGSFLFVLKFGVGRTHGVGFDRLRYGQLLLGKPAARSLAVQSSASDRSVDG